MSQGVHRWLNKRSKIKLFMVTEPAKLSRKSPLYLYPIYLSPDAVSAFGLGLIQGLIGATK